MAAGARVWDLPIRLFHWLLVALIAFSWWSVENREMEWHRWSGLGVAGLLMFRLLWGLVGSSTARFTGFLPTPGRLKAWAVGGERPSIGHNPLGALSVLAMLLALVLQVATGLFATDVDGLESGPLSFLISFETGRQQAERHELLFNIVLGLIALHLLAIMFYALVKRRNLVRPMLTGRDPDLAEEQGMRLGKPVAFAGCLAASALLAWALHKGLWM